MIKASIVAIMQILQWLLKGENEQERESKFSSSSKRGVTCDSNAKGNDIIQHKQSRGHRRRRRRRVEASKFGCKNVKISAFICTKDIAKARFYSASDRTQHSIYSMRMKREEMARGIGINNKADSAAAHVGNKVLPTTEASMLSASVDRNHDQFENKDQIKGDKKNKPISRMKELLRWAPAAKSEKGGKFNGRKVLQFRRRGTLKSITDDDQVSSDSPKISFTWEVESCSTTSSVYSAISITSSARNGHTQIAPSSISSSSELEPEHITCREGNWITTDSEFVVLEL